MLTRVTRAPNVMILLLFGFLAGCATPGEGLLTPVADASGGAETRTILAVTTRQPAASDPGRLYSGERDGQTHFSSLVVSLPPGRKPGEVPTPRRGPPDPRQHIALVSSRTLDRSQFFAEIRGDTRAPAAGPHSPRRAAKPAKPGPYALVFVHGFNTRFDEAVVRFAQIVDDTRFTGVPILFSWPSRGSVKEYGYDKDSANYSRDALENLLTSLAREPGLGGVTIFAHSMGNWVTMEALRDIALANDTQTLNRIEHVVLAAPDVDMDVFRAQMARLGPLANRMTVYASKDDYALQMSQRLFGGKIRAGENTDLDQFRALGVTAYDLSSVQGGVGRNHGKAFGDGATIAGIGQSLSSAPADRQDGTTTSLFGGQ